jgi:hypothetical protein
MVKEEWSERIRGIMDDIGPRMSQIQLLLKDEPVTVSISAIEDDVIVLNECCRMHMMIILRNIVLDMTFNTCQS